MSFLIIQNFVLNNFSHRSVIEDGPYGGDGGSAFTDGGAVHLNGPITGIELETGDNVDAIRVR